MSLCQSCSGINVQSLSLSEGYTHLASARMLVPSSKTCPLCALILKALNQNTSRSLEGSVAVQYYDEFRDDPIVLRGTGIYSSVSEEDEDDKLETIAGFDAYVEMIHGFDLVNVSLYTLSRSPTTLSPVVKARPPLHDTGPQWTLQLVTQWINSCLQSHVSCRKTFSGADINDETSVSLPTRVIEVGIDPDRQDVRLVETEGGSGSYVALSHCWGAHQIITTTTATMKERVKLIPFKDLSRTFQNAVTMTRDMGMRYIWIDSLCIIQDDNDDWRRESAKMGLCYENARFTLAATGAPDGRAGLFLPRTARPSVALPFVDEFGKHDTIYATLHPDERGGSLYYSPLRERAWITQEWLLSRRVIHFTQEQLVWSCRELVEAEDGQQLIEEAEQRLLGTLDAALSPIDGDITLADFYDDWSELIIIYSKRNLTYTTDKPVAIQGVVNEIAKRFPHPFTNGLWHDPSAIIRQIFWFATRPMHRPADLSSHPSWSWISTMGGIQYHIPMRTALQVAKRIDINKDNRLVIESYLVPLPNMTGPIKQDMPVFQQYRDFTSRATFDVGGSFSHPYHLYFLFGDGGERVGWVGFDESETVPLLGKDSSAVSGLFACVLSRNVKADGGDDGFNVLVLARHGDRFRRAGLGEVLVLPGFDGRGCRTVEVV